MKLTKPLCDKREYVIFIITRGRPDRQYTYETLRECGYTGEIFFVLDSDDDTISEYISKFGKESVLIVNKADSFADTDLFMSGNSLKTAVLTRNEALKLARRMGYKYLIQCDDDTKHYYYKMYVDGKFTSREIRSMDAVIDELLILFDATNSKILGITEEWRYFGGHNNKYVRQGWIPFATQFFISRTDVSWNWRGFYFDDTTMAHSSNYLGELVWATTMLSFLSVPFAITTSIGGQSENYSQNNAFYPQWFMPLISTPSFLKLRCREDGVYALTHSELHGIPKIINERYRK